jgi:hypothetical protein
VVPAVKAHLGSLDIWTRLERADLLETHDFP